MKKHKSEMLFCNSEGYYVWSNGRYYDVHNAHALVRPKSSHFRTIPSTWKVDWFDNYNVKQTKMTSSLVIIPFIIRGGKKDGKDKKFKKVGQSSPGTTRIEVE